MTGKRRISMHVTADLLEDDDGTTIVRDTRHGTTIGTNAEHLRRRAHDMVDAYAFALAQRVPPGPDLEYPDGDVGDGYICVATTDAARLADLIAASQAGISLEDAALMAELEGQLRTELAGRPLDVLRSKVAEGRKG